MKVLCCFLVIFLYITVITASYGNDEKNQFKTDFEKIEEFCLKNENLTIIGSLEDDVDEADENLYEWRCFLGCVSYELGLVSMILNFLL